MRKTLVASLAAAVIAASTVVAPQAVAETPEAPAAPAEPQKDDKSSREVSSIDTSKPAPVYPEIGAPADALKPLTPNPQQDPMWIDPEKNPLKKVSSSEMFLEWTDGMEEGKGKDFVQAWADGSSIPDTANPWELFKMELQGSTMMSSGLFTGDFAQSSRGSSQATSVVIPVLVGLFVIGQLSELVLRGLRMAGVQFPALTF